MDIRDTAFNAGYHYAIGRNDQFGMSLADPQTFAEAFSDQRVQADEAGPTIPSKFVPVRDAWDNWLQVGLINMSPRDIEIAYRDHLLFNVNTAREELITKHHDTALAAE